MTISRCVNDVTFQVSIELNSWLIGLYWCKTDKAGYGFDAFYFYVHLGPILIGFNTKEAALERLRAEAIK